MPKAPETVAQYIAAQPAAAQPVLRKVRSTIRAAIPTATETIAYQIPAYKLAGATVVFFGGFKQHFSIYPATAGVVSAFKAELAPYEVNNKGTIRFPLALPIPERLIARIAKHRAKEVAAEAQAKAKATPKATRTTPKQRKVARR